MFDIHFRVIILFETYLILNSNRGNIRGKIRDIKYHMYPVSSLYPVFRLLINLIEPNQDYEQVGEAPDPSLQHFFL